MTPDAEFVTECEAGTYDGDQLSAIARLCRIIRRIEARAHTIESQRDATRLQVEVLEKRIENQEEGER